MSLQEEAIVTSIRASKAAFDCPHCGAAIDGWMRDPRGVEENCDECGKPYKVAPDAGVTIT